MHDIPGCAAVQIKRILSEINNLLLQARRVPAAID